MNWDVIVIEVGSTITKVNGITRLGTDNPELGKRGSAITTVDSGVIDGLEEAKRDFLRTNNLKRLTYDKVLINSSAGGGLKMVAIGLTMDMTAKAAKEASLGAGAVLKYLTAGQLRAKDLKVIEKVEPNIILLCGGVDYGETETVLGNARSLSRLNLSVPLIYAGNKEIQEEMRDIFEGTDYLFYTSENVFPEIDELNIEQAKVLIQELFTEHIIKAKGMGRLEDIATEPILPTPGAVMNTVNLLADNGYDDILAIDIGGATTDVYSVTDGSEEYQRLSVSPEPRSKRTVEGDLGVYVNAQNIKQLIKAENPITLELVKALPSSEQEIKITRLLSSEAIKMAVQRHAGIIKTDLQSFKKRVYTKGKDLTAIKWIVGTGGVLSCLGDGFPLLKSIRAEHTNKFLLPPPSAELRLDSDYILSSVGMIASYSKSAALKLAERSIFKGAISIN